MKQKINRDRISHVLLHNMGSKFNLIFSSYITSGSKIIGLDMIKRKLLIAEKINGLFRPYIIGLNKVSIISVQKIYNSIKAGDLKKRRIEEFLQSIR